MKNKKQNGKMKRENSKICFADFLYNKGGKA